MNKNPIIAFVAIALFVVPFLSCRKDGMNSAEAKRIQYHWDRVSSSSATDYQNGRTVTCTENGESSRTVFLFGQVVLKETPT